MTKINFEKLKKESKAHAVEKEFNKTLFIPKKDSSYIVKVNCDNIEQKTKVSKLKNKEYLIYQFSNVEVDGVKKNWNIMQNTYDLFLELIEKLQPETAIFKIIVVTNDKGYISELKPFEEQAHTDAPEITEIEIDEEDL
jgi:alpha-L-fucosidase